MQKELEGKLVVVTGATSGIGLATAGLLIRQGAAVIGVGRSPERCRQAEEHLRQIDLNAQVAFCVADLSLQSQVRSLAIELGERLAAFGADCLDGLINNAGTFSYWLTLTEEGFELQWAVNHLAVFLLTHELMPYLQKAPSARVITVSSGSHYGTRLRWDDIQLRRRYNGLLAYKQTKLANVLFTFELNRRLGEQSAVHAFAADPGLVNTEIGLKDASRISRLVWNIRRKGGAPPEKPANGLVYLAVEPSLGSAKEIYWKDSQPKTPSPYALDPHSALHLWRLSEQMCGISSAAYGLGGLQASAPPQQTSTGAAKPALVLPQNPLPKGDA